MKNHYPIVLILILLGIHNLASAQRNTTILPKQIQQQIQQLSEKKDYEGAAKKYEQWLAEQTADVVAEEERYQASTYWALAGNKEKAFEQLYYLVKKESYTDFKRLSNEARFQSLYTDPRWVDIKKLINRNSTIIEEMTPYYRVWDWRGLNNVDMEEQFFVVNEKHSCMIPYYTEEGRVRFGRQATKNKLLIEPVFEQVLIVDSIGAIVRDSLGNYGLIQPNGKFLIKPKYSLLLKEGNLYHGMTSSEKVSRSLEGVPLDKFSDEYENNSTPVVHDYYDTDGNIVFSETANAHYSFRVGEDLAWFRFGKHIRVRDRTGKLIKETKWGKQGRNFLCTADNLLVYLEQKNENTIQYVAYTPDTDQEVFRCIAPYLTSTEVLNSFNIVLGVYQIAPNLYGIQERELYNMRYTLIDSLGNVLEIVSKDNLLGILHLEDNFFQQQYFVFQNRRESQCFLLDRQGDTILPRPIEEDSMLSDCDKIERLTKEKFACVTRGKEVYLYNARENTKKYLFDINEMATKKIDWSEEIAEKHTTKAAQEKYYYQYRLFRKYHELYAFHLLFTFSEGAVAYQPQNYLKVMTKDNSLETREDNVLLGAQYKYVNEAGETVLELPDDILFAGNFSEELAPAINSEGLLGYINTKGEWIITPEYSLDFDLYFLMSPIFAKSLLFRGGYAFIPEYGYIDKEGRAYFEKTDK